MHRFLGALAAVAVAALTAVGLAGATMEGHEASVVDPYYFCPLTPDIFGGINYPDTEPEPWVDRNPANPGNVIGAFQQDRWNDGGARGLVASWSFNDGSKWGVTALPFSKCAAPYYGGAVLPYDRASDPWVSIGPDGRAYTVSISFNSNDNNNAVGAATSVDGGVTWQNQKPIITDLDADPLFPFNDKESVTADPVRPGWAYVVWDRLVLVNCGVSGRAGAEPKADDRPWAPVGRDAAAAQEICFEGPTFFSRTTDGGVTWSPAVPIVPTAVDEQTIANQIVVDPRTDTLYNFYVYFPNVPPFTPELRMTSSTNGGATWSPQQFIETLEPVGIHDPQNPDEFARTGDIIPNPAVDAATGQLYLVWQDGRFNENGQDDVLISTSVQGGVTGTWTAPQRVNLPEDRAGFTMGIKVNDSSQVGVDYYSLRHPDQGPDVWPVDRYIRISSGPGLVAASQPGQRPTATFDFSTPTHAGGPFNMYMAPSAGGWFTGDYEGIFLDSDGKSFHTFFASTNCNSTNCPAVGSPTGVVPAKTSSPPDPFDVYSNRYTRGR